MKHFLPLFSALGFVAGLEMAAQAKGQNVFINAIHSENKVTGEIIETAGPASTDLADQHFDSDFPDSDAALEPQEVSIAEARNLPFGTQVIVNGTLTVAAELGGPAFMQDQTGGIALFDAQVHREGAFSTGDSLRVTASIGVFNEQVQLVQVTDIERFGAATHLIEPVQVSVSALSGALEGQLVTIRNASFADATGLLFPESNYRITDGTGTLELRIDGDVESLVGREIPQMAVAITGVIGSFRGALQMLPRFREDLPGTTAYAPEGTDIPIAQTLDVMTWNLAFFGSTLPDFGPADVPLQLQNAIRLIDHVRADIIAVQEISDEHLLQQLADRLGYQKICSDRYSYSFNAPDPAFPEQKVCFMYNPDVITVVDERVVFEDLYDAARGGVSTPLDAYPTGSPSSFWSSGRLPYMLTADATVEGVTKRIQLINIHAKSGSESADLSRKFYDVQALKDTLDQYYPNASILLLGDYNDDVDVSIGGGSSPYSSFVDGENFRVVTSTLSKAGLRSFIPQDNVIDHITISDEWYGYYLTGTETLIIPFSLIQNYVNTTSDHLPVLTRFRFTEPLSVHAGPDQNVNRGSLPAASLQVFPNPVTDYLTIQVGKSGNNREVEVVLYNNTGAEVYRKTHKSQKDNLMVDLRNTRLRQGLYYLKIGNASGNRTVRILKN